MAIKYRIYPAIGIARLGDSPDDYFIGPEAPGVAPTLNKPDGSSTQPGKYKDQQRRIKEAFDPGWLLNPSKVFPLRGVGMA